MSIARSREWESVELRGLEKVERKVMERERERNGFKY